MGPSSRPHTDFTCPTPSFQKSVKGSMLLFRLSEWSDTSYRSDMSIRGPPRCSPTYSGFRFPDSASRFAAKPEHRPSLGTVPGWRGSG